MKIFKNKWVKRGLYAVAAAVGIYWVVGYAIWQYDDYQTVVERLRQEKEAARLEEAIKTDAYGGKTPQETLQMFIDAVEAGDYELASKYFVVEKQEGELDDLRGAPIENIKNVMSLLEKVVQRLEDKKLSEDETNFVITDPILVLFIKYPSNIWKINEI